jgi:hypothetical protein
MESDSSESDLGFDMVKSLKRHGFTKTSKKVWKLDKKTYIITFVGSGPDPNCYDIRIRVPETDNFGDNNMRVLWKSLWDDADPVKSVIDWADANAIDTEAPGFLHEVQIGDAPKMQLTLSKMPDENRQIRIYTYGIAKRARKPDDSQKNWFVGTITTKPYGVDLRKYDGRSSQVQAGIAQDPKFNKIIQDIVESIETENMRCISIACTKGRHRSVAVAELLKSWFYPRAVVIHLTIA